MVGGGVVLPLCWGYGQLLHSSANKADDNLSRCNEKQQKLR